MKKIRLNDNSGYDACRKSILIKLKFFNVYYWFFVFITREIFEIGILGVQYISVISGVCFDFEDLRNFQLSIKTDFDVFDQLIS